MAFDFEDLVNSARFRLVKSQLIINKKSYVGFRCVQKSMTSNDLERNGYRQSAITKK